MIPYENGNGSTSESRELPFPFSSGIMVCPARWQSNTSTRSIISERSRVPRRKHSLIYCRQIRYAEKSREAPRGRRPHREQGVEGADAKVHMWTIRFLVMTDDRPHSHILGSTLPKARGCSLRNSTQSHWAYAKWPQCAVTRSCGTKSSGTLRSPESKCI